VQVLLQNIVDVRSFIAIITVIIIGFSIIFMKLLQKVPGACELKMETDGAGLTADCDPKPFANFIQSFYRTFLMSIMGDFDTEYLDKSESPGLARSLHILMCVLVSVIALNALIALLSDSFAGVKEDSTSSKRMGRAKLIVEYMHAIPATWLKKIEEESKWIYRVIPETEFVDGRIKLAETADIKIEEFEKKIEKRLSDWKLAYPKSETILRVFMK